MLNRKLRKLKPIPRMLIVCEGKLTEENYFSGVRRQFHIPKELVRLELAKGNPKTVVDLAVSLKNKNLAQNTLSSGSRFEQVWCVFDRDSHAHIPDAQQKAQAHKIRIAFSNPCFELFLLLHFCDCYAELHRDLVRKILEEEYLPGYDKSFDYVLLRDRYKDAKRRTTIINSRSEVQDQIQSAPFCSVPDLIDAITPSSSILWPPQKNASSKVK